MRRGAVASEQIVYQASLDALLENPFRIVGIQKGGYIFDVACGLATNPRR
jgi:hypothetical protein